jgi:aminomethyltransferase
MTAAIPTLVWLEDNAQGLDVSIEDTSEAYGGLALQGPTSRALLQQLADADLDSLRYFRLIEAKLAGVPTQISRTGYTGDLGYEIFVETNGAETIWDALMETGDGYGMRPAGNAALDMVRIEAGLLLIDADFTSSTQTLFEVQRSTPYELGLGWMIKLDKDYFIGRDALRREKERRPAWCTVGLEVDVVALEKLYSRFSMPLHLPYASWTDAVPIYADESAEQYIGKATSGTWSPIMKRYVAIARVKPGHATLGARVHMEATVEGQRFAVPAKVVKTPFFDPPRKKE